MDGDSTIKLTDSVLLATKKLLGLSKEVEAFDPDIIMHINASLSYLMMLGVIDTPVTISDETTKYSDFIDREDICHMAAMYIFYKTKLSFDPPASSIVTNSLREEMSHVEWNLVVLCGGNKNEEEEVS